MTLQDCEAMSKGGVSLEVIHRLHDANISCPICEEEVSTMLFEKIEKKGGEIT